MYPGSFVKIFQALHGLHGAVYLHHVGFKLTALAHIAAAVIKINLSVIIGKYTRVDQRFKARYIALHGEPARGRLARGHTERPRAVPCIAVAARMWKVKVICAVLIGAVGSRHKSALGPAPRHLARAQYLAVVCPVYHVVGGI